MNEYKIWTFDPTETEYGAKGVFRLIGGVIEYDLKSAIKTAQKKYENQSITIEVPGTRHRIDIGPEILSDEHIEEILEIVNEKVV